MIYVSGAEPAELRVMGESSNAPEAFGADFMFASDAFGMVGIQRKKFPEDLVASMNDGRLGKELIQLQALDVRILIFEGVPMFTDRGDLIYDYANMTKRSLINMQTSLVAHHGVTPWWTVSISDTFNTVMSIYDYCQKATSSSSLTGRVRKMKWGDGTAKEFAVFMAEGIPGIGRTRAEALVKKFGGLPVALTATREELLEVEGIGPKAADSIMRAFSNA